MSRWDNLTLDRLRELASNRDQTASTMAAILSSEFRERGEFTRSMICAKLNRLDITAENRGRKLGSPIGKPRASRESKTPLERREPNGNGFHAPAVFKAPAVPAPIVFDPSNLPKPSVRALPRAHRAGALAAINALPTVVSYAPGLCRWPCGDPLSEGFFFCSADARPGETYCDHHRVAGVDRKRR